MSQHVRVVKLLDNVSANGDGPVTGFTTRGVRGMYGLTQVIITGSATCTIFGRLDSTFPWKQITQFTTSDSAEIVLFPEMKASVSGYVSGNITCGVHGGM